MTILSPLLVQKFFDNNGVQLFNGQLYSYEAGTTTPLATYTDSTGGTPNANPVILNARGEADVWIPANTAYKFVLEDSAGNTIWTVDNVIQSQLMTLYGGADTGAANAYIVDFTANFSALADGIIVYFLPTNSNNGACTLNVNGTGVLPFVNSDGSALVQGQILASQITGALYRAGSWYFISPMTLPQTFAGGAIFKSTVTLPSASVITDSGGTTQSIGFLGTPFNTQNNNYTLVLADSGKTIYHSVTTAYTWTIPANASVAFPVGTIITMANAGTGGITIAITSDTLVWVPTGATGSRTLAQYGRAVLQKMGSTHWWISGLGVS